MVVRRKGEEGEQLQPAGPAQQAYSRNESGPLLDERPWEHWGCAIRRTLLARKRTRQLHMWAQASPRQLHEHMKPAASTGVGGLQLAIAPAPLGSALT